MAAAAAHAVKNNRKLHPKDGTVGQVPKIVLNSICSQFYRTKCPQNTIVSSLFLLSRSIKTLFVEVVINSPARNGWGETAEALHGEIAKVAIFLTIYRIYDIYWILTINVSQICILNNLFKPMLFWWKFVQMILFFINVGPSSANIGNVSFISLSRLTMEWLWFQTMSMVNSFKSRCCGLFNHPNIFPGTLGWRQRDCVQFSEHGLKITILVGTDFFCWVSLFPWSQSCKNVKI